MGRIGAVVVGPLPGRCKVLRRLGRTPWKSRTHDPAEWRQSWISVGAAE